MHERNQIRRNILVQWAIFVPPDVFVALINRLLLAGEAHPSERRRRRVKSSASFGGRRRRRRRRRPKSINVHQFFVPSTAHLHSAAPNDISVFLLLQIIDHNQRASYSNQERQYCNQQVALRHCSRSTFAVLLNLCRQLPKSTLRSMDFPHLLLLLQ